MCSRTALIRATKHKIKSVIIIVIVRKRIKLFDMECSHKTPVPFVPYNLDPSTCNTRGIPPKIYGGGGLTLIPAVQRVFRPLFQRFMTGGYNGSTIVPTSLPFYLQYKGIFPTIAPNMYGGGGSNNTLWPFYLQHKETPTQDYDGGGSKDTLSPDLDPSTCQIYGRAGGYNG